MLDAIRRAVPQSLKNQLKRMLGLPLSRLHPDWRILIPIGPIYRRHTILDIGSHHGWFFHCWKDWCPNAVIHAFEPREEAALRSIELYGDDPDLVVNQIAVGDVRGNRDFHVLEQSPVSSSFLTHDKEVWQEIKFHAGPVAERKVEVTTIDAYCEAHDLTSIYLIKIDVQGYEMRVLSAAKMVLPHTDHVLVEVAIRPMYEDAPDFTKVYHFMCRQGFHLMGMRAWHRGNHVLMESDMLFRRNELMPPVDESIDRRTQFIA
jgi:FkbM family methyltransferase